MGEQEATLIALAETTRPYVRADLCDGNLNVKREIGEYEKRYVKKDKKPLLRRLPSMLTPNFGKLKKGFHRWNCMKVRKVEEVSDEEIPMIHTRKSIDIGVGFARRASLFLFTRRAVCVHPYHPYTPKQTTRRIFIGTEEH